MTQNEELESLRLTNTIQQKVLKARGDELIEAIILLNKLLPIARKAVIVDKNELEVIGEANRFLHDER